MTENESSSQRETRILVIATSIILVAIFLTTILGEGDFLTGRTIAPPPDFEQMSVDELCMVAVDACKPENLEQGITTFHCQALFCDIDIDIRILDCGVYPVCEGYPFGPSVPPSDGGMYPPPTDTYPPPDAYPPPPSGPGVAEPLPLPPDAYPPPPADVIPPPPGAYPPPPGEEPLPPQPGSGSSTADQLEQFGICMARCMSKCGESNTEECSNNCDSNCRIDPSYGDEEEEEEEGVCTCISTDGQTTHSRKKIGCKIPCISTTKSCKVVPSGNGISGKPSWSGFWKTVREFVRDEARSEGVPNFYCIPKSPGCTGCTG